MRRSLPEHMPPPSRTLAEELAALWREVLRVEQVGLHDNFFDLGGNSLLLGEVQAGLHRILSREVALVDLLQHPTIATLAAHLEGGLPGDAAAEPRTPAAASTDIAIIGLEGRFPGAPDIERFWRNLREGVESIVPLADEQLRAAGLDPGALGPDRVRAEPLLAGIDRFDAAFFGLTPREAEALDPQQRLFLEDAWSCLERAGYDPARYPERIGVFAGSGFGTYALNLFANPELSESLDPISLQTSIDKDFLAMRVSYKLGLRGPSAAVQTACSTSLVAVHFARQSLLAGECDMALAGGVSLKSRQGSGYTYSEGAIFSPDGHCRAFDAGARGTVFGSGSGVVLLKRLDAALRDGDTIRAVLKGSAINNDGALKVGFTAPSVDGQAEVVAAALEAAGVSPESITYVEANGTGTPLGDPVEVAALTQAFRRGTERTGFCALGSVKTNVGHLNAAAGIVSLIKTVLALEHRQIPPSLHFTEPNPQIDFAASPFYVNAWLADWTVADGPRRAGVSSFGIGGTNAHVILEEAPPAPPASPSRERQLLLLSARTPAALEAATRNLADFLDAHPEQDLADVAWTLQVGRQVFEHRRFVVSEAIEDAVAALRHPTGMGRVDGTEPDSETPLDALGRLWLAGVEVDWPAFHAGERRRRIPLPTYPFERQRFWVEAPRHGLAARRSAAADDSRFVAVGGGEDFRGLLRDPRNAEALQRLLALEPDLRVLLPRRAPKAGPVAPAGSRAPAAGYRRPDLSTSYQAPQTGTELRLAAIWGDLLGIDPVGVHDDFFELGGHSLLATRLLSRLREAFGQEVPLATIFAEPTIARLAARLQAEPPGVPERPAIARVPRPGPLPLSFAQQRLWFIDQLEPGSPLYNIAVALRAEGRLRPEVLALTLGEIVRRHEALRTVFHVRDDTPVQVIRPAALFLLPVVDLSGLPESRREGLDRDLAGEEAGRPFDLTRDPMLRGLLLRQTPEDHIGLLTVHHIASDGWSLGLLVREVAALYAAFAEGRPSPLPELPVQYADFSVWQGAWLQGDVLDREISFWRSQLAGLPALLELPTDRPRPAVPSYRGATRRVRLSAELVRQAQAAARREGATLFMVLLAAFQTLLARYSGQQDLAVGSPVAGRNRLETEDLIGFFVNTLVLRNDLSGEPSFRELLGRTRETALAAHLHQDVPFEKLVQELAPERSLAHTPLFQVMFVLQNLALASLEIEHLRLRPVSAAGAMARFDLTLAFDESPGDLHGTFEYATDLFDAATVDRLMRHYERLLAGLLEEPGRRLGEMDLLTAEDALQLRAWNETATAWSLDRPLHAWIEEQVDRTPLAVAVICEGEELSYRELDRRANRLARRLRSLGVGPEARVAVCLERSAELVVALLAVLKAGGAYVPLDPEYPRERLAFMLADARPAALLSSEPLRDRLPAQKAPVVWLDREATSLEAGSGGRLPGGDAGALQLAYVIYTSGSTGVPKGVQVPHRALVNFLLSLRDLLEIGPRDRLLAITSLSFDIAALELYLPLLAGATVEVVHRGIAMDGERLRERLKASRTTFLQATPSTWRMLVRADWRGAPDLTVLCGGEALPEGLARDLTARARAVWNLYGPTETTVWSSADRLFAPTPRVMIGRPIANTAIHLLDRHIKPVPVGVPGELYIGGDGVTRGYLRRPDLTAERFLPDPFATDRPGLRLYRTGDLASRRPDGRVEFLGRVDHQVKLRGFRIEPGEIEAALAALAGVREAAVVVREDRLVAYIVGTATLKKLRRSLRERLPDYMVPAAFVTLAALPLTPNGKVDRKALPAPEWQGSTEGHVEPRTPVEEILAGIWAELLGLERVGATDHFFDRGGHSLLATQMVPRLRAAFGIELPLRAIFEAPVLGSLAARIEEVRRAGAGMAAPPLVPVAREGPLPLSFAQWRPWSIDQLEPASPLYNIPVVLRIEGPLDHAVLERCLGEAVRRHEALRTRPAPPCVLPLVDLSGLPARRRQVPARALTRDEAVRPFDLTRGMLLRGVLVRLAPPGDQTDHLLALTLHHIASDGWSLDILVREVAALYFYFVRRSPSTSAV